MSPLQNFPFPWGIPAPHLIFGFLGTAESTSQATSQSVHPFWHRSWLCPTDTNTDRMTDHSTLFQRIVTRDYCALYTYSYLLTYLLTYICSSRPDPCTLCMRCDLIILSLSVDTAMSAYRGIWLRCLLTPCDFVQHVSSRSVRLAANCYVPCTLVYLLLAVVTRTLWICHCTFEQGFLKLWSTTDVCCFQVTIFGKLFADMCILAYSVF